MSNHEMTAVAGAIPPGTEGRPGLLSSLAGSTVGVFTGFFEWFGNLGILASSQGRGHTAV